MTSELTAPMGNSNLIVPQANSLSLWLAVASLNTKMAGYSSPLHSPMSVSRLLLFSQSDARLGEEDRHRRHRTAR